jgi:8-oxo-dGTP pyrophosphatase MutT (NUDIX family)
MNQTTEAVSAKIWNSKLYTFPAGKINQAKTAAAARETYEETGFDPA